MSEGKIASNLMLATKTAPWRVTVANVWLPPLGVGCGVVGSGE